MEKKKKQSGFQKVANLTLYPYAAKAIKKKMGNRKTPAFGFSSAAIKAGRKASKKK